MTDPSFMPPGPTRLPGSNGGTLSVLVPVAESGSTSGNPRPLKGRQVPKRRILLVEDEGSVGRVTERLLTRFGYGVDTVAEGDQAIALYTAALATDEPFELVLTDLALSGHLDGEEVMGAILKLAPGAKGVVTSGYYDQAAFRDFKNHGFCGAIRKPYRLEDLQRVVQAALVPDPVKPVQPGPCAIKRNR